MKGLKCAKSNIIDFIYTSHVCEILYTPFVIFVVQIYNFSKWTLKSNIIKHFEVLKSTNFLLIVMKLILQIDFWWNDAHKKH
jgi:hypothetical protein